MGRSVQINTGPAPATKSNETDTPYQPWLHGNGWFYSCHADITDEVTGYLDDPLVMDPDEYAAWNGEATYTVGHTEETLGLVLERILQGVWGSSGTDIFAVGTG